MDLLARGRCALLIGLVGCGGPAGAPVGVSGYRSAKGASSAAARAEVKSPIPADFRSRFVKMSVRFASLDHFVGRYDGVIWASAEAAEAWRASSSFPDGARLVMEHLERGSERVGPLLMMERREGAWRWAMVTSDGRVPIDGDSKACSGCHAEAPRDGVFVRAP